MLNGRRRFGCCHRNEWLCLPAIDALPSCDAISKAPRAAGYRGSDFVLWHELTDSRQCSISSAIRGSSDVLARCAGAPSPGQSERQAANAVSRVARALLRRVQSSSFNPLSRQPTRNPQAHSMPLPGTVASPIYHLSSAMCPWAIAGVRGEARSFGSRLSAFGPVRPARAAGRS